MRLILAIGIVLIPLAALLWEGGSNERRYKSEACPHRIIYDYIPEDPMGLVTLGGSRVRVSTSERDFNAYLAEHRPDALPMHSVAHSIFSLEKEYVILRDLVEKHSPKSVLIMIEPRNKDFGAAHPDFVEIARLSDIPLAVTALWPEDPLNAVRAGRDILFEHLDIFDDITTQHREMTVLGCDTLDYRLDVTKLNRAETQRQSLGDRKLTWDLTGSDQDGFARWMDAYRAVAERSGTQVMFVLVSASSEPLPDPAIEQEFEALFGIPLITLDQDLHNELAIMGRRDASHINAPGREIFIPWLTAQIEAKCSRPDGCL